MAYSFSPRIFICEMVRIFVVSYFMRGQSTVYSCALHVKNMEFYNEQDYSSMFHVMVQNHTVTSKTELVDVTTTCFKSSRYFFRG